MRCALCGTDATRGQIVFTDQGQEPWCDWCANHHLPNPALLGGG